ISRRAAVVVPGGWCLVTSVADPHEQSQPASVRLTSAPAWTRAEWCIGLLLVVVVLATFGPVYRCSFVNYDDEDYVTHNTHLKAGITPQGLGWGLTTFYAANWPPLVWWSLLLDYQVYGPDRPGGFHVTNLLWHLGSTLLLFLALRRMTHAVWP